MSRISATTVKPLARAAAPHPPAAAVKSAKGTISDWVDDDAGCLDFDINGFKPQKLSEIPPAARNAVAGAAQGLKKEGFKIALYTMDASDDKNLKLVVVDGVDKGKGVGTKSYREDFVVFDAKTGRRLTSGAFKRGAQQPTFR